jgi:nitrogen-specific signal transduction histidine kinase
MDLHEQEKDSEDDQLRKLKHDIRNQLSNVHLALEQLKYELPDVNEECLFYIEMIDTSAKKINELLNGAE